MIKIDIRLSAALGPLALDIVDGNLAIDKDGDYATNDFVELFIRPDPSKNYTLSQLDELFDGIQFYLI